MLIFVNNKAITISESTHFVKDHSKNFDHVFDIKTEIVEFKELSGNVLIKNANFNNIMTFIKFAQSSKPERLGHLTFEVKNEELFKLKIKDKLQVIKAAGGVVENHEGKILMMKRLGFWDLPKGKAEANEKSKKTAEREVEEECGVTVMVNDKICTTWHTYMMKGKLVLKQTKWYAMKLISDKNMKPQIEEDIEELKWMNEEEVEQALKNSYNSIAHVLKKSEHSLLL
ncbi:NUDIX hydrolase [Lacihabitans soyangensis]|uniref:NUDIX domain-containing protein n=1 Tax=Lacihabitans soyangensis TaxID=869394 RepID=A0AAE3KWB3_9BACT|nr:NUDIX domain-containing protein [Lacihabitans soyangensis]MCP9762610.1 NUDIX domain-containing protein [Lacihabitans soyangensis]